MWGYGLEVSTESHDPAALSQGKSFPWNPLNRSPDGLLDASKSQEFENKFKIIGR
jgi:hypothetical protein